MDAADKRFLIDHPDLFLAHYFPHRLDGDLKPFHLELIDAATTAMHGLILEPAQHGKTTILTLLQIHALCRNPNVRVGFIGKNEAESEQVARGLQAELADNDDLIRDFGPFRPGDQSGKPWSLKRMSVEKRTLRAKEPTLGFFGAGSKAVLGWRTNWTICDDVVVNENSSTPEQQAKLAQWFNLSTATMPLPGGRLTVAGTRFDVRDLYADLMALTDAAGERLYVLVHHDAIVDDEKHLTLWPEYWPWPLLMDRRLEVGTLEFNKRYRNQPVDESRMVFREEYVKGGTIRGQTFPGCLDPDYSVGDYDDSWVRAGGFDPAVGVKRKAKFCAHLTVGAGSCLLHERCYWVIDLLRDQMEVPRQADEILARHDQYELFVSRVETNAYQMGLQQIIEERMRERGLAFRVQPHLTDARKKIDPEIGIGQMAVWFEKGAFHIPWRDAPSRTRMQILVDELIQYPGRTTDTVMALWMAWLALEEGVARFRSFNRLDKAKTAFGKKTPRYGARIVRNPIYEEV